MSSQDWIASAEVHDALERLGPVLVDTARAHHPLLTRQAGYLASLGGKRIRPALLFIAHGRGCTVPKVLRAAAAVELIHLASLYHDDIIDRGQLRRGAASANARWGNRAAMLTGTFLFIRAQAAAELLGPGIHALFTATTTELCLGQLREAENAYDLELPVEAHLEVLTLKTGALFRLALQIGASLGGAAPIEAEALAAYGRHLGLAFQLSDDLLDIADDPATTGKDGLADIRAGIYSLPWLLALLGEPERAEALRRLLGQHRLSAAGAAEARAILRATDAPAQARAVLSDEIARCRGALAPVKDAATRSSLTALAEMMCSRDR